MASVPFDQVADFFRGLQDRICAGLEAADGKARFREDAWQRPGGGGGRTRVIKDGAHFENGGVSFSLVHGEFGAEMARRLPGVGRAFRATGLSLVLHPFSPMVPTVHANFRLLTRETDWWFGGGADLTPYYPFAQDCVHFHRVWRDCCHRHATVADYQKLKSWCDEYFYLPHRQEHRGIGGIFFDYLRGDFDALFAFVRDAGDSFLPAYLPILERRKNEPFGQTEKEFQLYRRGRYVEFNLVYDRGTMFGLQTQGGTESILMSLPPRVRWEYDYQPAPGSREAQLLDFLKPRDWANGEGEVPRK